MDSSQARHDMVQTASAMLEGKLSFIDGARRIVSLRVAAGLESDPDVMAFVAIDSETDAFPDTSTKAFWQPEALAKLQPEVDKAEAWAQENLSGASRRLIARLRQP